uniref:Chorismate mutase-like protein n=1 Tax=Streptoalloteichus sp. ATCC 53650 TaxID=756733 RepID=K4PC09_9PSEU|nr:chorismate mutase-like protein [Streptoalloteichus sp. ATCC 53650]
MQTVAAIYDKFAIQNSAVIRHGDTFHFSGLSALDRTTGEAVPGDIAEQARYTLETLAGVLADVGLSLDNVIKLNAYLTVPERDFAQWNAVYLERFRAPYPCRTTVGAHLVSGLIEIDAVASVESRIA